MNVLRGIPFGISRPLFENYLVEFLQKQELFDGHASDEETEEESGQSRDERHKVKKMDVDFKSRLGNGLLDLSKAVRSANFRLVHQLLKTPLTEMLSTVPPDLPSAKKKPTLKFCFGKFKILLFRKIPSYPSNVFFYLFTIFATFI